jgi:hypothetical protein
MLREEELERLKKALDAGVVLAVPAALHYCREHELQAPAWAIQAALDLLCDLLKRETSQNLGRSGGAVARHRQDLVDFIRWNEVEVLRENQERSIPLMSEYPNHHGMPTPVWHRHLPRRHGPLTGRLWHWPVNFLSGMRRPVTDD